MEANMFIAPPLATDFDYMTIALCQADRDELREIAGVTNKTLNQEMKGYFMRSFVSYTLIDANTQQPMAVFGICAQEHEIENEESGTNRVIVGYPWLLTNGDANKYPKEFMQKSKAFIESQAPHFSYLHVVASEKHPFSIPYLKKLGFKEDAAIDLPNIKGTVLRYV